VWLTNKLNFARHIKAHVKAVVERIQSPIFSLEKT